MREALENISPAAIPICLNMLEQHLTRILAQVTCFSHCALCSLSEEGHCFSLLGTMALHYNHVFVLYVVDSNHILELSFLTRDFLLAKVGYTSTMCQAFFACYRFVLIMRCIRATFRSTDSTLRFLFVLVYMCVCYCDCYDLTGC